MSKLNELFPGLDNIAKDVGAELGRLGVQGSAELAQALFTGQGYVPYGRGQAAPNDHDNPTPEVSKPEITPNQEPGVHGKHEPQLERGGMEM